MKKIIMFALLGFFALPAFANDFPDADLNKPKAQIPDIDAANLKESEPFKFEVGFGKNAKILKPVPAQQRTKGPGGAAGTPVFHLNNDGQMDFYLEAGPKIPGTAISVGFAKADNCPAKKCDDSQYAIITLTHQRKTYGANAYKVANYSFVKSGYEDLNVNGTVYRVKMLVNDRNNAFVNDVEISVNKKVVYKDRLQNILSQLTSKIPQVTLGRSTYFVGLSSGFTQNAKWAISKNPANKYLILIDTKNFNNMLFLDFNKISAAETAFPALPGYTFKVENGSTIITKF